MNASCGMGGEAYVDVVCNGGVFGNFSNGVNRSQCPQCNGTFCGVNFHVMKLNIKENLFENCL